MGSCTALVDPVKVYAVKKSAFKGGNFRVDDIYLLLAEYEVRTASYGPSFFLPFMAQAGSARAMKTRKEKSRIHNLPYGPIKQG